MAIHSTPLIFTFGLLGNIISCLVLLAPMPTFIKIYKRKSTEGFQSLPYVTALFSAMLWIYYALLKTGANYLITINSIACVIETIYIVIFLIYAPRRARILTIKLLLLLNIGALCLIVLVIQLLAKGQKRVQLVGGFCVALSVSVFVAPLTIVWLVVRTKSVEYMPFTLSFFLTLSAVMWFSYGFLLRDYYIALPNILGFIFGMVQMVLYLIYKGCNKKIQVKEEEKTEEQIIDMVKLAGTMGGREVHPVDGQPQPEAVLGEEAITNVADEEQEKHENDDAGTNPKPTKDDSEEHMGTANEVQDIVCANCQG